MEIVARPPGSLSWNAHDVRCALGRGGVRADKREGDGATPVGTFPLRRVHYRPDRLSAPPTDLPVRALTPDDGWCDDPGDPAYNRLVTLPFAAGHETLWRADGLYDLLVELGYNDDPVEPGAGSAIFLHVAAADYAPTEGCVAVALGDLQALIAACGGDSALTVSPETAPAPA